MYQILAHPISLKKGPKLTELDMNRETLTTDTDEIQNVVREYFKNIAQAGLKLKSCLRLLSIEIMGTCKQAHLFYKPSVSHLRNHFLDQGHEESLLLFFFFSAYI